jgi:signal transduction histidine kinase/DNA-binding response OmpR family regulator/ligand-binding sensor domain-containing protein
MKKLITILSFLLVGAFASGKEYDVDRLTNGDGLSNSSVTCIFQDSSLQMWFGTWDGLNRYNGSGFRVYRPLQDDQSSISNNVIRDIVEEGDGILWIATDRGINRYDPETDTFSRFFSESPGVLEHSFHLMKGPDGTVFVYLSGKGLFSYVRNKGSFVKVASCRALNAEKCHIDRNGDFWMLTTDGRLLHSRKGSIDNVRDVFRPLGGDSVLSFHADAGSVWIQRSRTGYYRYDLSSGTISKPYKFAGGRITSVAFEEGGTQLIGTLSGLFRFNPSDGSFKLVLPDLRVLSVFSGSQKIIWVGTDMRGIFKLSNEPDFFSKYPAAGNDPFNGCAVRSFHNDNEGRLWVGTKGNGITLFSHVDDKLTPARHITTSDGLLNNSVYSIEGDGNVIWIGTDGQGLNYYDRSDGKIRVLEVPKKMSGRLNLSSVYSILHDKDVLWIGTSGRGIYRVEIDRKTKPYSVKGYRQFIYRKGGKSLSNDVVYSMVYDGASTLWVGTRGGGLNRMNMKDMTFEQVSLEADHSKGLEPGDILSLCLSSDGSLWVGTSLGLYLLPDKGNGKPIHFSEKDGLPNNTVHGILEGQNGGMWLSTNGGLARLIRSAEGVSIVSYNIKDGLQNNEFSDGAYYRSGNLLYFGGISGFNVLDPAEVASSTYTPSLYLEDFLLDNERAVLKDHLKVVRGHRTLVIGSGVKSFGFRFFPIDYISSDKCGIEYLLDGYDKDWIRLGNSNAIAFSKVGHGSYTLKVRCSDSDGVWVEDTFVLPVKILPAWYETVLAKMALALLIITLLFAAYRFIVYRERVKRKIHDDQMEKDKMSEIHEAKLQFFTSIAHEFSNSLTLIYGPCEELLKNGDISSKDMKYLNVIESNSNRMQNLIQQLISFRKAETGHLSLKMEPIDVPDLIRYESAFFADSFEHGRVTFSSIFRPETLIWQTDRDSFEKIVFNLISNAVKYTPSGEKIIVSVTAPAGQEGMMRLEVTNTGVGIPKEKQLSIFDRYEVLNKFENDISKGKTSNGIGLATCKSLAELLGGSIGIKSDEKTFTTFFVEIPSRPVDDQTPADDESELKAEKAFEAENEEDSEEKVQEEGRQDATENDSSSEAAERKTIMVVDDDAGIRGFIKDLLSDEYAIVEASDGNEALDRIKDGIPDLVISDVMMPGMDGVELLRNVKTGNLTSHVPVILLSAKSSLESQIFGLEKGADAYLGKPFNPRQLTVTVRNLLERDKAIMDYSNSALSAIEQFNGSIVRKEDREFVIAVTDIIKKNIDNDALTVDMIASEALVSCMQLYRKVKEILGISPMEYVIKIRLDAACRLLRTTHKTVQEIMFECGFNNKANFYRLFSKHFNMTPKEYRTRESE